MPAIGPRSPVNVPSWRDAIDAMGRAQVGVTFGIGRDSLPGALRTLELRLVSMRVFADSARPET